MITLVVILLILAVLVAMICGVSMLLLDPIIAILIIIGIYRLIKRFIFKKKK